MKRAGGLYPRIAEPDTLRLAFWKASRGKRHKPDVMRFRENLDTELEGVRRELEAESVRVGAYRYFTIHDPKQRTICAAPFRERVLHHAIVHVCEPAFERYQIHDSYACRTGKGVHKALEKIGAHTRTRAYFLKLDVRRYFDSIRHATLGDLLERRFKDRPLLRLLETIVASYQTAPGCGLPIGNLTSQYFANHYLAALDHFVKETLCVRAYVRYMDDFFLWADHRAELAGWHREVEGFARDHLGLELKPPVLNRSARGLTALGYRVYPDRVWLARRSRDRFARKLKQCDLLWERGEITEQEAALRVEPLLAFTRHASTSGLRRQLLLGVAPVARTGSTGAAAGTTTPRTPGPPSATTTTPATGTTTSASASPQLRREADALH